MDKMNKYFIWQERAQTFNPPLWIIAIATLISTLIWNIHKSLLAFITAYVFSFVFTMICLWAARRFCWWRASKQ